MRQVSDRERRDRMGRRLGLAARVATVEDAVASVVCLHSTEPPSVHLAVHARAEVAHGDVERALYADRSLVKQLAMRRTLFTFPRNLLPAAWGSASARVATQTAARLAKQVEAGGLALDGAAWITRTGDAVLRTLDLDGPATTAELRERVPALSLRLEQSPGKPYGGAFPVAAQVLTVLGASGRVLRGDNAIDWRQSRPRWTLTGQWLGEPPTPLSAEDGYRTLVERWLRQFGPGTETDIVWWLGATKGAVRRALADLEAVEVALDSGATGYLLPDDLGHEPDVEPWAALLPVLDSATMGWKERQFYLEPDDVPYLFDTNGNGGTTAWWDGRVVGCWVQDPDGVVQVIRRHDVGAEGERALEAEADRLTAWLAGQRISSIYASAQMKQARLP